MIFEEQKAFPNFKKIIIEFFNLLFASKEQKLCLNAFKEIEFLYDKNVTTKHDAGLAWIDIKEMVTSQIINSKAVINETINEKNITPRILVVKLIFAEAKRNIINNIQPNFVDRGMRQIADLMLEELEKSNEISKEERVKIRQNIFS